MARISHQFIIALLIFLSSIVIITACTPKAGSVQRQYNAETNEHRHATMTTVSQGEQKLRLSIPDAPWVPIFFKSLETHIKDLNLPNLRTVVLQDGDLEMRFWADALPNGLDGVILRRINNQWSAVRIQGRYDNQKFPLIRKDLPAPRSGWDGVWVRLVNTEILTLPDGSDVNCNVITMDGITFIIETNFNWSYRTYAYGNPHSAKCNEAKQIISIASILFDEFSLEPMKF